MKKRIVTVTLGMMIAALAACGGPPRVQRVNPNEQIDLSGDWNDTDSNQVARVMLQDCLSRPWSNQFKSEKGRPPVVMLHMIRNRSDEHINTKYFTKQVEMELLNSGVVKVVSGTDEKWDSRAELADQAQYASDASKKEFRQETGSDFQLHGWITFQHDRLDGQEVRAFLITMELTNVETQEKVWIKAHTIKKMINRPSSEW